MCFKYVPFISEPNKYSLFQKIKSALLWYLLLNSSKILGTTYIIGKWTNEFNIPQNYFVLKFHLRLTASKAKKVVLDSLCVL